MEAIRNENDKKLRVMCVEDDKFLLNTLASHLSKAGFDLIYSDKGENVVALAEKEKPDIILLDILLPGIDGFEVLRQLKANPKLKNVPVIILSNLGQRTDIQKGLDLGADKFLIKATVMLDDIIREIKSVLAKNTN